MFTRYSIKNLMRQPGKMVLYSVLVTITTIFCVMGVTMLDSAIAMQESANETFVTQARIEYYSGTAGEEAWSDTDYQTEYKQTDWQKIYGFPEVLSVNEEVEARAVLEEKIALNQGAFKDYGMIQFEITQMEVDVLDEFVITAKVTDSLYGTLKKDQYFILASLDNQGNELSEQLEIGKTYFAYGILGKGRWTYPTFTVTKPEWEAAKAEDVPLETLSALTDMTEGMPGEQRELWEQLAESLETANQAYRVRAISDISLTDEFYQGITSIEEGRLFSENDYRSAAKKCIISSQMAELFQVKVGDTLAFDLFYGESGEPNQSYWTESGFYDESVYEVVGIYTYTADMQSAIFIPLQPEMSQQKTSYVMAQFRIKNGMGDTFLKHLSELFSDNVESTVLDQGYEQTIAPILNLRNQALVLTGCSILMTILLLFLLEWIYLQKEAYNNRIMLELGTTKKERKKYLISGIVFFSACGVLTGLILTLLLAKPLLWAVCNHMQNSMGMDLRYSELQAVIELKMADYVTVSPLVCIGVILGIEAVIMVIGSLLINKYEKNTTDTQKGTKRKKLWHRVKETNTGDTKVDKTFAKEIKALPLPFIQNSSLRYALIAMWRGKKQSILLFMAAFAMAGVVLLLNIEKQGQQMQLETLDETTETTAYVTGFNRYSREAAAITFENTALMFLETGMSDDVNLTALDIYYELFAKFRDSYFEEKDLPTQQRYEKAHQFYQDFVEHIVAQETYISDFGISNRMAYEYEGLAQEALVCPDTPYHTSNYGNDWFYAKMQRMDRVVFTDHLNYLSELSDAAEGYKFLEGYDASFPQQGDAVCMVSENFLKNQKLSLGDTIRLAVYMNDNGIKLSMMDIKIIGSYGKTSLGNQIYVPVNVLFGSVFVPDLAYEETLEEYKNMSAMELSQRNDIVFGINKISTVSSFGFTISDNALLDAYREVLYEKGISNMAEIRDTRRIVIIRDGIYIRVKQALERHISMMNVLIPVLMLLLGGIIGVVDFILIKGNRSELMIMRELGTAKRQIRNRLFLQHFSGVFLGTLPVVIAACFTRERFTNVIGQLGVILMFAVGIICAVEISLRKTVLDMQDVEKE